MALKDSVKIMSQRNTENVGTEESTNDERKSVNRNRDKTNGHTDTQKSAEKTENEGNEDKGRVSSSVGGVRSRGKGKEMIENKTEEIKDKTIIEEAPNEENQTTITNKSIIVFQISLFLLYFIILLIGSCNFSFKLFHAKEKHVRESVANIRTPTCKNSLKEKVNEPQLFFKEEKIKEVLSTDSQIGSNINKEQKIKNPLLHNNFNETGKNKKNGYNENIQDEGEKRYTHTFFKYYFTRTKQFLKKENKTHTHNGPVKIFICLNKNQNFNFNNIYNLLSVFKRYLLHFLYFYWNEIKGAFIKKKEPFDFLESYENNENTNEYITNKYLHYYYQLKKHKGSYINKSYINIEALFYIYLQNICFLHDVDYINGKKEQYVEGEWLQPFMLYDKNKRSLNLESKRNMTFLINHINEYLNDKTFMNVLNSLYVQICRNNSLLKYLKKENVCNKKTKNSQQKWQDKDVGIGDEEISCFKHHRYFTLYNRIQHFREVNKYIVSINMMRTKIYTLEVLNKLDNCVKQYIINLKNVPLYFFLNIFYDTPCYVYNKIITNLLSNYYKGLFLYFIIFLGCIHVFFSPFPITLVHFRRFFIYFIIIMYRLFIFYFFPSIIQYIFYKFNHFEEEYKHIFDYSDHVILFSTLLFIISLETQAIKYTINHQKQSFDNFHYKYNRKLCYFFLKLVLYYYYMLIFFFLYTSYFTSKYFHTPNEIFVAYFFSTFSIFILFYFFLYKGYFSFYNLGITSFVRKESNVPTALFTSPFLPNTSNVINLKEKLSLD